jgi:catechol 2,3-dioxygenase-like lactoylglutathione lyase family enzyme
MDMKLEVVMIGVSEIDRAKAFYQNLGWRFDGDFPVGDDFRVVQMTPPNSQCSIIFGKGIRSAKPGLADSLVLAVDDIDAARDDLLARGAPVSEVFHYAGGPFNMAGANPRVPGRDPENRTYFTFASFADPDGNTWLLQEITTRLAGREWESPARAGAADAATLAKLLRETSEHHDPYEKSHGEHHWYDWYAPYLSARQNGSTPDEAAATADRYMEQVLGRASPMAEVEHAAT